MPTKRKSKIMTWEEVSEEFMAKYDRHVVFCRDIYERDYIVKLVQKARPHYSYTEVEAAIDTCCGSARVLSRKIFFECLQRQLG
jgi:hypothetical protein